MATPTATAAAPPAAQRLRRVRKGAVLGGVCAGLSRTLGVDALVLRLVFVVLAFAGGAGVAAYAVAWALIPGQGARLTSRGGRGGWRVAAGIGLLVLAALLLMRSLGFWFSDALVWPLVLTSVGLALIWRQTGVGEPVAPGAKDAGSPSAPDAPPSPRRDLLAPVLARLPRSLAVSLPHPGREVTLRVLLGAVLVILGGLAFLEANGALRAARDVTLSVLVVVVGSVLVFGPWWVRLGRTLAAERAERIRSQERAEVAAHLHDSVLQTLALIQRRAADPREVAGLARRQERELRVWLSGKETRPPGESLAAALEEAAASVEDTYGVAVEAVVVGDSVLDERLGALVAAAREALTNAARFAGSDTGDERIALFADIGADRVQVFVRDRGPGFDLDAVPADRRGVRESIVGRMERHGGRAAVHTAPGAGTEVELVVERVPA